MTAIEETIHLVMTAQMANLGKYFAVLKWKRGAVEGLGIENSKQLGGYSIP